MSPRIDPGRAGIYEAKARRFASTARRALEAGEWDPAVSTAVHAAIAAVDAVCVRHLGRRSASDDHADAPAMLSDIAGLPAPERATVVRHARALLGMKHRAEYEDRLVTEEEAKSAVQHLERLLAMVDRWMREAPP